MPCSFSCWQVFSETLSFCNNCSCFYRTVTEKSREQEEMDKVEASNCSGNLIRSKSVLVLLVTEIVTLNKIANSDIQFDDISVNLWRFGVFYSLTLQTGVNSCLCAFHTHPLETWQCTSGVVDQCQKPQRIWQPLMLNCIVYLCQETSWFWHQLAHQRMCSLPEAYLSKTKSCHY